MAGLGHALILAGVSLILWQSFESWPGGSALLLFYIMEGVVVAFGFISIISARQIISVIDEWVTMDRAEGWMNDHPNWKDGAQDFILILIFVLQFGAMAALVVATSGPIESPFAPMALAIGVFTPFIVNRGLTIALIILTTMAFYVIMIVVVGLGGHDSSPEPASYAAVNLFILLLASVLTFKRRDSFSFTVKRVVEASPERAWLAWTDQDEVANWIRSDIGGEPEVSMDVRDGGAWRAVLGGRGGQPRAPWSGRYLKVEPYKELVFTVNARSGMGEEVISVKLKPRGERATEIVMTQTDHGRFDGLKKGWERFLARMHGQLLSHVDTRPHTGSDS
jgi:uncharacterized protein YndB with AHSA1/START domain